LVPFAIFISLTKIFPRMNAVRHIYLTPPKAKTEFLHRVPIKN